MFNIAIMGCGNIAKRVANGIIYSDGVLYAAASRDITKAREFAWKYPTCKAMCYEDVLQDENVDLVYIATINTAHYDLIRRCLMAGKNVICEKPMLANEAEIKEVFALAEKQHCFLMEAHKTCFIPLNTTVYEKIQEGLIGKVQSIEAFRCDAVDISCLKEWNVYEPGMGGAFFDIGVYPLCFVNRYAQSRIKEIEVNEKHCDGYPNDIYADVTLTYENGVKAEVAAGWKKAKGRGATITGEKGRIEFSDYWKGTNAKVILENEEFEIQVEQDSDFSGEINEAIHCIENGQLQSSVMNEEASLEIMKVLCRVKESEEKK